MKGKGLNIDIILLSAVLLLVGFSLVMVYSASSFYALKKFGDEFFFLKRQAVFAGAGILVIYLASRVDARFWYYAAYPMLLISIILLLAVFTKFGKTVGGSTRWLSFGGMNMQPSELAKLSIVIFLAYSIEKKAKRMKEFSIGILPHLIIISVLFLLIMLEPDFGNAAIILLLSLCMLYAGGARLSHLVLLVLAGLPLLLYEIFHAGYRIKRLLVFLDPWKDASGAGFQVIQSFLAFGSGGLFGRGLGDGRQKLFYLPASHTDFIFSNIGEELGFMGVFFTVILFAVIAWRGYFIARDAQAAFLNYLAAGIVLLIIMEATINMCVGLGALPTKGLTLPFVSYGGSSMLVNCLCIGILLNISSKGKWR